jgi:ribosomal protein S18 acetylase RimI-like enzyme
MHTTVYEACPEIYIKQEINIQPVIAPVPYQHSQFFDWGMLMKMDYLHVEEVVDIELACFPESPYEEVLFNKYISKQLDFHHSGSIRGCFINYVAMDHDEKVIGYSMTRVMLKCSNLGPKFLEGHIYSIAVSPQHRRMKIGDTLLQHSIGNVKWLQGLLSIPEACITLNVNVNNIGAQRLYSRTGFKTQMWNQKYYQDVSEDALFMKLDL